MGQKSLCCTNRSRSTSFARLCPAAMAEPNTSDQTEEGALRLKATKLSVEQVLSELFLRFTTKEGKIQGFAGTWTFYRPNSAEDNAVTSSFRCVRTYEVLESVPTMVRFRTFNEHEPTNGRAWQRSQDGVYESGYQRLASDTFFTSNMSLSEAERREGLPECVYWRCVAVDAQNVIRIAPMLPPRPHELQSDILAQYPGWSQQIISLGAFAFEAFIEDGENRWALGALYSIQSLQLLSHFCIQEHMTALEPDEPINFAKLEFKAPRGRLSEHVDQWLEKRSFRGGMSEVIWDEDGDSLKLPPRPTTWTPPNPNSETHRLFLYPDSMYAFYPLQLPSIHETSDNTFNHGARFEMGGLCRCSSPENEGTVEESGSEEDEFRRLILRYAPAGHVTSLTKEVFKTSGSFEFEKRKSTSVRRSMDQRHNPNLGGQQLMSRRWADQRAKGANQAYSQAGMLQKPDAASENPS